MKRNWSHPYGKTFGRKAPVAGLIPNGQGSVARCLPRGPTGFAGLPSEQESQEAIDQALKAGPLTAPQADQDKIAYLVHLFESGDVLGVADVASRYAEQFPRSVLVWNVAAAANGVLGRSENAIECFEPVVQINPTDADAHSNLSVLLQEEGRLKAAADSYRRAIALRPNDAAKKYQRVLEIEPNNYDAYCD